ncbi:MAG: hypothetical protein M3P30_11645 [Chloroflexota bacterium]|nr:hypothetical protein [Chloroflexota bacterium]
MPSERVQRQIDRLLDDAEAAVAEKNWVRVREFGGSVLAADPENQDARVFLAMADAAEQTPTKRP